MKKFLYYPNFEPPNNTWLKFSLLYLDNFESIIPYNRQHLITDEYREIHDKTDLVDFFSPEYQHGETASFNAINEAKRILRQTYESSFLFNRINIARDWRNKDSWDYQIFGEKFSYSWVQFCEDEEIGKQNNDGILLPRSLAFLYMTHLAKEIANDRNSNIITDNLDYDRYTSYSKVNPTNVRVKNKFIQGIIKLQVPKNLNDIPFKKLIEFRNKNRELITVFNSEIDSAEEMIGNGLSEQQFIDNYNKSLTEITKEVIKLGIDSATIPLGFYTLAQNSDALNQDYIKEILTGLSIIGGGYYGIRKALTDTRQERLCKKYLTRLNQL
ncbi:hypothetical protein [Chryseobacterium sp.]|uniref:hypothetical protein n=1 Tax=Chryseobacterium sp. TaxID=1871047 RepID=UPI00289E857D|nr:hypothetical protein [Chryseobacterium sp.]